MPSELSRRLDDFRTKNKVVPPVQKVSFLFDPRKAVGLDILSLALIARKSLLDLAIVEPALALFEDLFDGAGKSIDFLLPEEQKELQSRIKRLLSFLSGHFRTLDCQQCIEYLIQKYQIHVYNGEDLILFALPYHETVQFGSLVKLIPWIKKAGQATASESRWMFLRNVHATGSPLSRLALIKMCRSSQPVLTAIIEHAIDSLRHGAYNQPLLSFLNVLLVLILSEFDQIRYDVSVIVFSLCRICFKAASHSVSAFFVGLSLATHIVCVADVRDDALAILLTRAISACPSDKVHSLILALSVIASRRVGQNAWLSTVSGALEKIDRSIFAAAVQHALAVQPSVDLSLLVSALGSHELAALMSSTIAAAMVPVPVVAVAAAPVVEEPIPSDDSSDEEEEDDLYSARKVLVGLINKGSKQNRADAVHEYAPLTGSTRHCIRLAAACDSLELLAETMRHNKSDMGWVETLTSVLPQFTAHPALVLEAVFAHNSRVPEGAMARLFPDSETFVSLLAVALNAASAFTLTSGTWCAMAAIAATAQLAQSTLISEWRTSWVPRGFLSQFLQSKESVSTFVTRFLEFANNCTKQSGNIVESVLGQAVFSIAASSLISAAIRREMKLFAQQSLNELSVSDRTKLVTLVLESKIPILLKKILNDFFVSQLLVSDERLIAAMRGVMDSVDGWRVVHKLVTQNGVRLQSGDLKEAICRISENEKLAILAWQCVPVMEDITCLAPMAVQGIQAATANTPLVAAQVAALSAIASNGLPEDQIEAVVSSLIEFSLLISDQNDPLVVACQSICESLLAVANFSHSWTTVVHVMAQDVSKQVRSLVLLNSVLAREDVETSKELGQVLLGLAELVSPTSTADPPMSWVGIKNTEIERNSLIEQALVAFMASCTLRKLDQMFRKLPDTPVLLLRVYTAMAEQGGAAVVLALLPQISDRICQACSPSIEGGKRKRDSEVVVAALAAICASCVEELPEPNLAEFMQAVAALRLADEAPLKEACLSLARIASIDQTKTFTKLLMSETREPTAQEQVVNLVYYLWNKCGEAMVPAITEVTMFLNELYHSKDSNVAEATLRLVKEIDRVTGEDIQGKLDA